MSVTFFGSKRLNFPRRELSKSPIDFTSESLNLLSNTSGLMFGSFGVDATSSSFIQMSDWFPIDLSSNTWFHVNAWDITSLFECERLFSAITWLFNYFDFGMNFFDSYFGCNGVGFFAGGGM